MDAKQEILARIRRATIDITEKDPVKDQPVNWTYGGGIEMEHPACADDRACSDIAARACTARCALRTRCCTCADCREYCSVSL